LQPVPPTYKGAIDECAGKPGSPGTRGVRIEVFTVIWMVVEAVVSSGAGVLAGSALLTAFGLDSVVELISGAILLWRLLVEARGEDAEYVEQAERRSAWVVFVCLALLCLYVLGTSLNGLVTKARPEGSLIGIAIAAAAVLVMPWLAFTKRRIAARIESGALRGDAASSLTCGYMAGAVLVGVLLNTLFHWWWAEDVAALVFLMFLFQETREVLEEARGYADGDVD
jgi:divalent metal cation (Fe/Co/Zn/Cd) transporter